MSIRLDPRRISGAVVLAALAEGLASVAWLP
jgi:hypothetical protein